MNATHIGMLLGLVAIGFVAARELRPPDTAAAAPVAPAAPAQKPIARQPRFVVAFRLDPELTQGFYLGERWVSPPSFFFAQQGTQYVVRARAQRIDGRGAREDLSGNWSASDPEMVAITRHGNEPVTIVVRKPGESDLRVSAGGSSTVVHVSAAQVGDSIQVDFSQQ